MRKTITAFALAVALGITGLGSTLSASAADESVQARAVSCTPGYRPCIPNRASDVDSYGGSGNGPRYTRPSVVYRVRGADRYRLDADNDGRGWSSGPVMATTRGLLYTLARLMGDVNAVKKGTVGKRIGRRITGKMTGRLLGRLFR